MNKYLNALFFTAFFFSACANAALSVGDHVTLIDRDNGIPAHPADGDSYLSFRFQSSSDGQVEAVGNWIKIKGKTTDGNTDSGWIAKQYIETSTGGGPNLPDVGSGSELDWCPPKGSAQKHSSGRLRIASWNLEALHAKNGQSVFADSIKRDDVDYERIKCYTRLIDADILAVQEVDGEEALKRVVDTDVYNILVAKRNQHQETAFAYKKGLNVTPKEDFKALDVGNVRYGTRIDVTHNGKTIRLMSVHLKSGCFSNDSSNTSAACVTLQKQVPIMEQWIDESATTADGFIILGDFNRRLDLKGDLVWKEWDDKKPANADLTSVTANMPISCRDNEFTSFIDHIVLDKRAAAWFDPASFRQITFRQEDKENWGQISDHCPIVSELWVK